MSIRGGLLISFGVAVAIGGGSPLVAAADSASDQSGQLQEIIVTAQKRQENLQTVPISAQVVGGELQREMNENLLTDLSQTVPDVHLQTQEPSSDMYIRGIGSGLNAAFEQSVGTFIDDIYYGKSKVTAETLLDIDRVEILKGPQSTYFGNNAIAGALNIVTNQPTDNFEGWARALYGSYDQYATEAAVSGPITDTLAARLAVSYNGMGGWMRDVITGYREGGQRNLGGRLTLLFHPNSDLDVTLKIAGSKNRIVAGANANPAQITDCPPPAPFTAGPTCLEAQGLHVPIGLDTNSNGDQAGQEYNLETGGYVLTANYRQWGQTFTSVSGFYDYRANLNVDASGLPIPFLDGSEPEYYRQFSQEFRIASPTGQTIEYLAGAYYQTDHLDTALNANLPFLNSTIESVPPFAPLVPYLPLGYLISYTQPEDVYSVFGSVTWNVTQNLKLIAGLRGSWDHKSFGETTTFGTGTTVYDGLVPLPANLVPLAGAILGPPEPFAGTRTDSAWMPSAKIQYQIDADKMVYAAYSNGFKAGGFNSLSRTGPSANLYFQPEKVNAYEIGLKSKWFNDTLLLNLDFFRSDYTDLQVGNYVVNSACPTGCSVVSNAASSVSQGVEFEGKWVASASFNLAANIDYLDAYYSQYPNALPTALQTLNMQASQNMSGRPTEFAPDFSASVTATVIVPLPGGFRMSTSVSPYFSGSYYYNATDDPYLRQPSYVRLDGRVTIESPDRRWAFDVIGKNITNRTIVFTGNDLNLSPGSLLLSKEEPANFAAQIRLHW